MEEIEKFLLCNLSDFDFDETYMVTFIAIYKFLSKRDGTCDYKDLYYKFLKWVKTEGKNWIELHEEMKDDQLAILFIYDLDLT